MTEMGPALRAFEEFKLAGDEPGCDENWAFTALNLANTAIAELLAEVARLNRVLRAGREEYELVVTEMNRLKAEHDD